MDNDNESIPLVEGDDREPDVEINPVEGEDVPDDPEMSDPSGLPRESFVADADDTDGTSGHLDEVPAEEA